MIIVIESDVDPKSLRINHRYLNISRTPPEIAKAFKQLVADVQAVRDRIGATINKESRVEVHITYTMNDLRADVDGPSKRTLDAVAAGLGYNDGHNDVVVLRRGPVGNPGIHAIVKTLTHHDPVPLEPVGEGEEWEIGSGDLFPEVEK